MITAHRVTIRLRRNKNGTPWKWCGYCTCGWGCMSWSWSREYGLIQSGMTLEAYIAEGNSLDGGTLPMALDHLHEKASAA